MFSDDPVVRALDNLIDYCDKMHAELTREPREVAGSYFLQGKLDGVSEVRRYALTLKAWARDERASDGKKDTEVEIPRPEMT